MDPQTARKKSNVDRYVKQIAREEGGTKQQVARTIEDFYDEGIVVNRRNRNLYELEHPDSQYTITTTGLRESRVLLRDIDEVKNLLESPRRRRDQKQNYRALVNIFREEWKRF